MSFQLQLDAKALSDRGQNPSRSVNEDACYSVQEDPNRPALPITTRGALFIAADGVGGSQGGSHASQKAVEVVSQAYYRGTGNPQADLVEALNIANREIYHEQISNSSLFGMSTTMVAAVILDTQLIIAHAGDSRIYRLRGGQLQQLTQDHSLVEEMVARGMITPEEAASHTQKNVITRSLGAKLQVDVDSQMLDFQSGDVLLLCSDGLCNVVSAAELAAILTQSRPASVMTQQLINLANERGGPDNITAVVVRGGKPGKVVPVPMAASSSPRKSEPAKPGLLILLMALVVLSVVGFAALVYSALQPSSSHVQSKIPEPTSIEKPAALQNSPSAELEKYQLAAMTPKNGDIVRSNDPLTFTWVMKGLPDSARYQLAVTMPDSTLIRNDPDDYKPSAEDTYAYAFTDTNKWPNSLPTGQYTWQVLIIDKNSEPLPGVQPPVWTFTVEGVPASSPVPGGSTQLPAPTVTVMPTAIQQCNNGKEHNSEGKCECPAGTRWNDKPADNGGWCAAIETPTSRHCPEGQSWNDTTQKCVAH